MKPEHLTIAGPAGRLEVIVDLPPTPRGIALVAHPHPKGGGANTNKVAHTLARALSDLGYSAWRPNFRGVGKSEGQYDEGRGEVEDLMATLEAARQRHGDLPVVLAGFSFGAYCQTHVARRLADAGKPAERLVLVGTAAGHVEGLRHYDTDAVPADSIVIHGAEDTTVPLDNVFAWALPLDLPVIVIPGADHFFHRRLHLIRDVITRAWNGGPGIPGR